MKYLSLLLLVLASAIANAAQMPATVRILQEKSTEDLLAIVIETETSTRNLHLTRTVVQAPTIKDIELADDGSVVILNGTFNGNDFITLYEDESTMGIFYLNDFSKLEGVITLNESLTYENGQHYILEHEEEEEAADGPSGMCATGDKHLVKSPKFADTLKAVDDISNRQYPSYIVEAVALVDSVYARRFSSSNLVKYMALFFKTVDRIYATVSGANVNVRLITVYRSGSERVDARFESFYNGNSNQLDVVDTVDNKLASFIYSLRNYLVSFDVLQLMTTKTLSYISNGQVVTSSIIGKAYDIGGACEFSTADSHARNVGITRDRIYFSGRATAAHEIAHTLGVYHDSQGTSSACLWQAGYLMSYVRESYRTLFFSYCSSYNMLSYIRSSRGTCLRTIANSRYISYPSSSAGEMYSLQTQCRYATGVSNAEPDLRFNEEHCHKLRCTYVINNRRYYWSSFFSALEGSQCPRGGRCLLGFCV